MAIYLKNASYIDPNSFKITNTHIKVNEGIDASIEFVSELDDSAKVIDCQNKLVTKSFAIGHHHVYSALARGMDAPKKNPENFYEVLKYIWWTLDKSLDLEMIEASALVTAIYAAKAGSTFVIDHHASPFAVLGSLETLAKAFDKVGVSHLLCYEISDRDGESSRTQGLEETENYLASGRQGLVGLHASFTVGDKTLNQAVELAKKYNSGIHVHVAEDRYDQDHCLVNYSQRVIERFQQAGVLDFDKSIIAHVLYLSQKEKEILRDAPAWVVGNMESNLNNSVGIFRADGLGDKVMLGTDGMHSDMLRSSQMAFFAGQMAEQPGFDTIYNRLRNSHRYLKENNFKGDGDNNLVIFDYDSPTELTSDNFLGHLIFGLDSRHVETVISDGKVIVENRKATNVNEEEIYAFAKKAGKRLWKKMQER